MAGDLIGQQIQPDLQKTLTETGTKTDTVTETETDMDTDKFPGWDARRTAVYAILGCGWTGFFNHYYLQVLSTKFPVSAGLRSAVLKTCVNQLAVAPLVFVP